MAAPVVAGWGRHFTSIDTLALCWAIISISTLATAVSAFSRPTSSRPMVVVSIFVVIFRSFM